MAFVAILIAVASLLYAVSIHRRARVSMGAGAAFWKAVDIELERGRRHNNPVALLRLTSDGSAAADGLRRTFDTYKPRMLDRVLHMEGEAYLLAPHTDRDGAATLAGRLLANAPNGLAVNIGCFPGDAITRHGLIAHVVGPRVADGREAPQVSSPIPDYRRAS